MTINITLGHLRIFLAFLGIVLIISGVVSRLSEDPLPAVARQALTALKNGDSATLHRLSSKQDREVNSLTPESISAIHTRIIAPVIADLKAGQVGSETNHRSQGYASVSQSSRTQFGETVYLSASAQRDEKGVVYSSFSAQIYLAWLNAGTLKSRRNSDMFAAQRFILEGLNRDEVFLKSQGFRGFLVRDAFTKKLVLTPLERFRRIAEDAASGVTPPPASYIEG